jgi:hypothetical protein
VSSPVNITRDGLWCTLVDADEIAWSTELAISPNGHLNVNGDGSVHDDVLRVRPQRGAVPSITAANWRAVGGMLPAPENEPAAYRVKTAMNHVNQVLHLGIGYAPASPTGSDDLVEELAVFPLLHNENNLFMIEPLDSSHALYGRALYFALIISSNTSYFTFGGMSVQRLSTRAPQYAKSIP